ncbi:MAG: hypothetical protein ACK4GN_05715 [Runella sp.]
MKKQFLLVVAFSLAVVVNAFAQTADAPAKDFFAGKWEIAVFGTPNGDAKFLTELVRKDGKLGGELKEASGQIADAIPITNLEEEADKITLYFSVMGYDVNVELAKVDDDNLKGMLMGMFESKAVRIK